MESDDSGWLYGESTPRGGEIGSIIRVDTFVHVNESRKIDEYWHSRNSHNTSYPAYDQRWVSLSKLSVPQTPHNPFAGR